MKELIKRILVRKAQIILGYFHPGNDAQDSFSPYLSALYRLLLENLEAELWVLNEENKLPGAFKKLPQVITNKTKKKLKRVDVILWPYINDSDFRVINKIAKEHLIITLDKKIIEFKNKDKYIIINCLEDWHQVISGIIATKKINQSKKKIPYCKSFIKINSLSLESFIAGENKNTKEPHNNCQIFNEIKRMPHKSVAVIAHVFYSDLASELIVNLKNIEQEFDLIVTLPTWGTDKIKQHIKQSFPNAFFCHFENSGRDIAPFIELLPLIIERQYKLVLKVHSKKGFFYKGKYYHDKGERWRQKLWQGLFGSKRNVNAIIHAFNENKNISLLGVGHLLVPLKNYPLDNYQHIVQTYFKKPLAISGSEKFFAGSMFWFRPEIFEKIANVGLTVESFKGEFGANHGQLEHALERIFGHIVAHERKQMAAIYEVEKQAIIKLDPQPIQLRIGDVL